VTAAGYALDILSRSIMERMGQIARINAKKNIARMMSFPLYEAYYRR